MSAAQAPQFNQLDRVVEFQPDPTIWRDNLTAIAGVDSILRDQLRATDVPGHWRSVRALCGTPTWRIEPPAAEPLWLSGSAAPAVRAAALLAGVTVTDKNPALPSIATGAELALLLERLAPWQAVYVFETDLPRLACVLRLLPLAGAIADRRCIFIRPDAQETSLLQLLEREPGLLPPGNVLRIPGVPDDSVSALHAICERVASTVAAQRADRLAALAREIARAATPVESTPGELRPRLALLAPLADPETHALAGWLADAAAALGWPVLACTADAPLRIHPLAHAEAVAAFLPTLTIAIDCPGDALGMGIPGDVCSWRLRAHSAQSFTAQRGSGPSASSPGPQRILAASPQVERALRASGVPNDSIIRWYRAARDMPLPPATTVALRRVLLVADRPDDEPSACGIDQPTHKRLWSTLRELAAEHWRDARVAAPRTLLAQAEAGAALRVESDEIRGDLIRLIERVIIPAAVVNGIVETLRRDEIEVLAFGTGWGGRADRLFRHAADQSYDLAGPLAALAADSSSEAPLAVVIADSDDPLSAALLEAAARGWAVVRYGEFPGSDLGGIAQPADIGTFHGPSDLRAALSELQDAQRRAERITRLAQRVLSRHTYTQRLKGLAAELAGGGERR